MAEVSLGWRSPCSDGHYNLTFERDLPYAQRDVWRAVTSPRHLGRWLSKAEIELRPKGRFQLRGRCSVDGEVLKADAPSLFSWTWPHPDHPASEVHISIEPSGEAATRLILVQTNLPKHHLIDIAAGWHTHLDALPAAVQGRPTSFDPAREAINRRRYSVELQL